MLSIASESLGCSVVVGKILDVVSATTKTKVGRVEFNVVPAFMLSRNDRNCYS